METVQTQEMIEHDVEALFQIVMDMAMKLMKETGSTNS